MTRAYGALGASSGTRWTGGKTIAGAIAGTIAGAIAGAIRAYASRISGGMRSKARTGAGAGAIGGARAGKIGGARAGTRAEGAEFESSSSSSRNFLKAPMLFSMAGENDRTELTAANRPLLTHSTDKS